MGERLPRANAESARASFTLLGDQPYVLDGDPLGFAKIADDLATLVLASRGSTPFTLGIDAGWGMGKSSLMRRLQQRLSSHPEIVTVWFNAWTSEGQSVLEGLIKSVLNEIDPSILRRTFRRKQLMSWLRAVAMVLAGWLRINSIVDQIWHQISVDPRTRNEIKDLMVRSMDQWLEAGRSLGGERLLVVFIDDLDRCSPTNVLQVFEAVKLYLDAPGFVFVIGYDKNIISDSILEERRYSKAIKSSDYLEKIVQIGYRIPQPDDDQAGHLIERYLEESQTSRLLEESARALVIERNQRNPRRIKRFINGFILEYGLDEEWQQFGAEVLVKALILYMYFPDFTRLISGQAERDPFSEFLDYLEARNTLRKQQAPGPNEWPVIVTAFVNYGLGEPREDAPHQDLLQRLEREVPEPFIAMAKDDNFISLVRSLGDAGERDRFWKKLERRRISSALPHSEPTPVSEEFGTGAPSVAGFRVVWIDDDLQPGDRDIAEWLTAGGASVHLVQDYDSLVRQLKSAPAPHVLVSDIRRGQVDGAGFSELEHLRKDRHYLGPVIFYTARVTSSRRAEADRLGALGITSDPTELVQMLQALAVRKPEAAPVQPASTVKVFLEYRRDDARAYAGRLADRLRSHFGSDAVFMDIEAIQLGVDFVESLVQALESSHVVLALIGPNWLSASDSQGRRRLDDPDDIVRVALRAAFERNIRVIPVLVDGASIPRQDELPADIAQLARINAIALDDARWDYDVERLIEAVERLGVMSVAQPTASANPA